MIKNVYIAAYVVTFVTIFLIPGVFANLEDPEKKEISTLEEEISTLEKRLPTLKETIETQKKIANDPNTDEFGRSRANEIITNSLSAIKDNEREIAELKSAPIFKLKRIDDDYIKRIESNKTKKGELEKLTASDDKTLKIDGNTKYGAFLAAKRAYDLCVERNKNDSTKLASDCNTSLKAAVETTANAVRDVVKQMTKSEVERNKTATFDVSGFFSLGEPTTPRVQRTVGDVVNQIADWMITLASSLAVTALIIGGFMMVISGGEEEKLNEGKEIFKYALTGLAVTLLAYAIISVIQGLFYR